MTTQLDDENPSVEWEETPEGETTDAAPENDDIEVIDDTPERDRGRKPLDKPVDDPTEEELNSYTAGVQKRIKELTHARHDERRKAEALAREKTELERIARAMMDENSKLKQYVQTGEQEYSKAVTSVAESELEQARRKLKEAHESFDTDAIIAAQEALSDAKMKLERAKNFRPAPLQTSQEVVQTAQQAATPQVDDKTLRWQARNQWFGASGYEDTTAFALGLHQKLVNSGVDPRSDEYFEQIDARLHATFPDVFGNKAKPAAEGGSKKPSTVVAPATRSSSTKKIQLTSTQVALARKLGITPQQYAVELAKLEKQNG
jgi:hypothetical protein